MWGNLGVNGFMMVSSLFLPAACRCVLSPLYPVPTHLKRGICIVFSANNIHVYSSIFTVFPSSPQVFPRESGPFPRRKSPSVGSEAVFFPAAAGLVKAAGPSRLAVTVLRRQTPCTGTAAAKGLRGVPASVLQESASRGHTAKVFPGLPFSANQKAAPSGTAFAGFISFLAAPGGRPRSGRG